MKHVQSKTNEPWSKHGTQLMVIQLSFWILIPDDPDPKLDHFGAILVLNPLVLGITHVKKHSILAGYRGAI